MAEAKVILVTGVGGYWGAKVAERLISIADLSSEQNYHIIGLDTAPPEEAIKDLDFIRADVRNPLLIDLLKSEQVHTVCHLSFMETLRTGEASFDANVMGTMKVVGACSEAGVQKVILKSSTVVYGAYPDNPAFITEQNPINGSRAYGYSRDLVEIEAFCNGFQRQVPEMQLTILRFPGIIGPRAETPLTEDDPTIAR